MKLTTKQKTDLHALLLEQIEGITELTGRAVLANAEHQRSATVNLIVKIARNADDPSLIEVNVQEKIKAPKARTSDLTQWSEPTLIMSFSLREEQGQQKLEGTEA